jgi:hypothetical protein
MRVSTNMSLTQTANRHLGIWTALTTLDLNSVTHIKCAYNQINHILIRSCVICRYTSNELKIELIWHVLQFEATRCKRKMRGLTIDQLLDQVYRF